MASKIQIRRDTASNWTSANPTLSIGELGLETDTDKIKVGDGSTAWTSLGYLIDTGGYAVTSGNLSQFADVTGSVGTSGNILTSNGSVWASAAPAAAGVSYVTKTATYTTQDLEGVLADTSGGAFTVTLPASPSTGDQVVIADSGGVFASNNLTVGRNSSTISGDASDLVLDISSVSVQLVYDGSTWEVYAQVGGSGGTAVTLTGTQTLTNKTLTSPTLTTPALGTPSALVLTNATGTLTSPTLVTPALGTPASGVITNVSGTAANLTAGNATTLATARTIGGVSFDGSANIAPNIVTDTTPQLGGALDGQDNTVSKINLKDYGEVTNAIGGTGGGTQDIDLTLGNSITATVDTSANTFTFSNPTASDELCGFTLYLTNGGSQTVTWPGTVDWAGATAPTLTAAGVDVLVFETVDGGTIWNGFLAGTAMS